MYIVYTSGSGYKYIVYLLYVYIPSIFQWCLQKTCICTCIYIYIYYTHIYIYIFIHILYIYINIYIYIYCCTYCVYSTYCCIYIYILSIFQRYIYTPSLGKARATKRSVNNFVLKRNFLFVSVSMIEKDLYESALLSRIISRRDSKSVLQCVAVCGRVLWCVAACLHESALGGTLLSRIISSR